MKDVKDGHEHYSHAKKPFVYSLHVGFNSGSVWFIRVAREGRGNKMNDVMDWRDVNLICVAWLR